VLERALRRNVLFPVEWLEQDNGMPTLCQETLHTDSPRPLTYGFAANLCQLSSMAAAKETQLGLTNTALRPVSTIRVAHYLLPISNSLVFPGAVNSKFVTALQFERPSERAAIPTYRVMDSDGVVVDQNWSSSDLSPEQILTWYRDMLTGTTSRACFRKRPLLIDASQHHGRDHVRRSETG